MSSKADSISEGDIVVLSEEQKIREMWANGTPPREIAETLELPVRTIFKALKRIQRSLLTSDHL